MQALIDRMHKRRPQKLAAQSLGPRSLALETYHLQWSLDEVRLLMEAENKYPIYATLGDENRSGSFQTLILKADVAANSLWLDNFHPVLTTSALYKNGPFSIAVAMKDKHLILRCIAVGESGLCSGEALAVKIIAKHWFDPAGISQIGFDRESAPPVKLLVPMRACLAGQILKISPLEFEMTTFDLKDWHLRGLEAECTISFSESFCFQALTKIKGSKTHRKPHSHRKLQGEFIQLTPHKREQLQAFVRILSLKT